MDEHVYKIGLVLILLGELIFTTPLLIDAMVGKEDITILLILVLMHGGLYLWGALLRLNNFNSKLHWFGGAAYMGSFIPLVGFILHGVTAYKIYKHLRQTIFQ